MSDNLQDFDYMSGQEDNGQARPSYVGSTGDQQGVGQGGMQSGGQAAFGGQQSDGQGTVLDGGQTAVGDQQGNDQGRRSDNGFGYGHAEASYQSLLAYERGRVSPTASDRYASYAEPAQNPTGIRAQAAVPMSPFHSDYNSLPSNVQQTFPAFSRNQRHAVQEMADQQGQAATILMAAPPGAPVSNVAALSVAPVSNVAVPLNQNQNLRGLEVPGLNGIPNMIIDYPVNMTATNKGRYISQELTVNGHMAHSVDRAGGMCQRCVARKKTHCRVLRGDPAKVWPNADEKPGGILRGNVCGYCRGMNKGHADICNDEFREGNASGQ